MLVERRHDALVDGGGGGIHDGQCVVGRAEAVDDLAYGDEFGQADLGFGEGGGELLDQFGLVLRRIPRSAV
ncbi:hypothetical protein [Streptomyces sp. NPDC051218]|uniref:hypothetical protein n=1 Tax=Streptomyces sp. NPDC051218 TaxID=3365645 RepID=UPI0037AB396E